MMERLDDGEFWNMYLHAVNVLIEIHCFIAADIDKVEVKHQNVQTKSPEMKDQNTWTEIVKDEEVQAENTAQQQGILTASEAVFGAQSFQ